MQRWADVDPSVKLATSPAWAWLLVALNYTNTVLLVSIVLHTVVGAIVTALIAKDFATDDDDSDEDQMSMVVPFTPTASSSAGVAQPAAPSPSTERIAANSDVAEAKDGGDVRSPFDRKSKSALHAELREAKIDHYVDKACAPRRPW